jgi:hypothetical protein
LSQLKKENLSQSVYFAEREHTFLTEKLESLKEKYEKIKEPTKTFTFKRMIWLPKNYKIVSILLFLNKHELIIFIVIITFFLDKQYFEKI